MQPNNVVQLNEKDFKSKKFTFNTEVYKYIKENIDDKDYTKLVQNNPQEVFASIDKMKLAMMESFLFCDSAPSMIVNKEDILSVELNLEDQQVIKNDCHRTRVRESAIFPDFENTLEKIITYYCFSQKINYKQGMNEIFGPLLLLKFKIPDLKLVKIYQLGEIFIKKFLPNYFYEKEFYSLKSALGLFKILLRYHAPSVYNRLDQYNILPEMYATNWFLTFLSAKIGLNILYDYWMEIIKTGDPLIIQFIFISFIIIKRELIINCDKNLLASLMTSLSFKKKEEIKTIIDMALKLREETPYSFRILANKLGFLKHNNKEVKKMYEKYQLQSMPAMPIFPLELLSLTYQSGIDCIDPDCRNSKNKVLNLIKEEEFCVIDKDETDNKLNYHKLFDENHICEKCDMKIEKKIKYITLDLRIKNDENDRTWVLPNVIDVDKNELLSPDFSKVITDRFIPERGFYHFIFMTSNTDFFSDFEDKLYKDNLTEKEKLMLKIGVMEETKIKKELNLEEVKNLPNKDKYSIKEYDNMRQTLDCMQKKNFPYVGFVYGGWKQIHETSFLQNITLVNHDEEKCSLCLERRKQHKKKDKKINDNLEKELWKSQTKVKIEDLNKIMENKNNFLCICVMKEFKGKKVKNEIAIALKEESFKMEIYKFANERKNYNDSIIENNKEYIEKQKKNKIYYDLGEDFQEDIEFILFENIRITHILEMRSDEKNKNIIIMNYIGDASDKKKLLKKGINNNENLIKIDFPTTKESKNFANSFKNLMKLYRNKIKKK
jgi:hypothetical protein